MPYFVISINFASQTFSNEFLCSITIHNKNYYVGLDQTISRVKKSCIVPNTYKIKCILLILKQEILLVHIHLINNNNNNVSTALCHFVPQSKMCITITVLLVL